MTNARTKSEVIPEQSAEDVPLIELAADEADDAAPDEVDFSQPAPVVMPTYLRSARKSGDVASRLGFEVGACIQDLKFSGFWVWTVFHLGHAAIVGTLEAPIFLLNRTDVVEVRIFDAEGELVLSTDLKFLNTGSVRGEFDEIRMSPGDYLLAFRVGGGSGSSGSGDYPHANVGVFIHGVPDRPILDRLIANRSWSGVPKVATPQWRFFAE
jgi:hypothetical protein